MKNLKTFGLTFFLFLGIIIPGCEDPDCNCPDETFFDVEGLELSFYQDAELETSIAPLDSVSFDSAKYLHLDYLVDYHTSVEKKRDWSFSLINSAYACSCIFEPYESKNEDLVSFSIITLNDFDDDHLANSSIIDLFDYNGFFIEDYFNLNQNTPLPEHLASQLNKTLYGEDMVLQLKKAPELNQEFKIKVMMELSTGETYEVESESIYIMP